MIIVRLPNRGLYLDSKLFKILKTTEYDPKHNYGEGVLFWGCTVRGEHASRVYNRSAAYDLLRDKPAFRKFVSSQGCRIPGTIYTPADLLSFVEMRPDFSPMIGRPRYHHGGQDIHLIDDLEKAKASIALGDAYWSTYLPKDREVRVFVAFGRVWAVSEKQVPDPALLAWNHENGGVFKILRWSEWPTRACYYALLAAATTGIAVASFDFIRYSNHWYLLEGNTSTRLTGAYKQRQLKRILMYHDVNPEMFGAQMDKRDYRLYLHPALESEDN